MNNVCDHADCPAAASHVILTPSGLITLCAHHTRENAAEFLSRGYEVLEYQLDREVALAIRAAA
jgi:hypothetical protein